VSLRSPFSCLHLTVPAHRRSIIPLCQDTFSSRHRFRVTDARIARSSAPLPQRTYGAFEITPRLRGGANLPKPLPAHPRRRYRSKRRAPPVLRNSASSTDGGELEGVRVDNIKFRCAKFCERRNVAYCMDVVSYLSMRQIVVFLQTAADIIWLVKATFHYHQQYDAVGSQRP
jgi:hypothetical protein